MRGLPIPLANLETHDSAISFELESVFVVFLVVLFSGGLRNLRAISVAMGRYETSEAHVRVTKCHRPHTMKTTCCALGPCSGTTGAGAAGAITATVGCAGLNAVAPETPSMESKVSNFNLCPHGGLCIGRKSNVVIEEACACCAEVTMSRSPPRS